MTWRLSCNRCNADYDRDISGEENPRLPKGWKTGRFLHHLKGEDLWEGCDFCPECVAKYGTSYTSPWPLFPGVAEAIEAKS